MQQRSEETRARILQAAQQLFSDNGYDATGVAELCQTAGVSKGAFYHHFPSKQAVFMALLENWLAALDGQMATLFADTDNVAQGLVRAAGITGMVFQSASGQLPMFLEFWREASHDPLVWQTTVGPFRRYQELFAAIVERGIADGSLSPVNSGAASRAILALATGLILQGVIDPQGAAWDQVTRESFQMLLKGISK